MDRYIYCVYKGGIDIKSFKNLKELESYIQQQLNETLKDEVFEEVRDTIQKHIDSDVYDVYSPTVYNRRETSGGLIADENIVGETISDGMIEIKDIASPSKSIKGTTYDNSNPTMFSRWINDGLVPNIFNNKDGYPWTEPRPFMDNAREDLSNNNQHFEALKRGLKKRKVL